MVQITPLSLYVVNQVKIRRLILGISAERLSILIKRSHGYVLTAENPNVKSHYPAHEWPNLALALKYSIHDLLPVGHSESTGELVDKVVISLAEVGDLKLVLEGMLSNAFFAERRTLMEVEKHLFLEKADQREALAKALMLLVRSGKLVSLDGGFAVGDVV